MYIRSQDKKKQIDTCGTPISIKAGKKSSYLIIGILGENTYLTLGEYADEKTAIDVMDMIEENIRCKMTLFDMPKDIKK